MFVCTVDKENLTSNAREVTAQMYPISSTDIELVPFGNLTLFLWKLKKYYGSLWTNYAVSPLLEALQSRESLRNTSVEDKNRDKKNRIR